MIFVKKWHFYVFTITLIKPFYDQKTEFLSFFYQLCAFVTSRWRVCRKPFVGGGRPQRSAQRESSSSATPPRLAPIQFIDFIVYYWLLFFAFWGFGGSGPGNRFFGVSGRPEIGPKRRSKNWHFSRTVRFRALRRKELKASKKSTFWEGPKSTYKSQ